MSLNLHGSPTCVWQGGLMKSNSGDVIFVTSAKKMGVARWHSLKHRKMK